MCGTVYNVVLCWPFALASVRSPLRTTHGRLDLGQRSAVAAVATVLAGWLYKSQAAVGSLFMAYLRENKGLTVARDLYNYPAGAVQSYPGD